MRSIGKSAAMIITVATLLLLMSEVTWACGIYCSRDRHPPCQLECKKGQPMPHRGVAKIVIGKGGVTIKNVKPPQGWKAVLIEIPKDGNELHLIPPEPIQKEVRVPLNFESSDKEVLGFQFRIEEFQTRQILEVGYTTAD